MNDPKFKGLYTDNKTMLFSSDDPIESNIAQRQKSIPASEVNTYVDLPLNADYWKEASIEKVPSRQLRDNGAKALDDEEKAYGYNPYYKGLAEFLVHCETPMTVAIQGPWGSGKSSTINSVAREIYEIERPSYNAKSASIRIELWNFSPLKLGEALPFAVLAHVLYKIQELSQRQGKQQCFDFQLLAKVSTLPIIALGANLLVPGLGSLPTTIAGNYTNASKKLKNNKHSGVVDAAQEFEDLKDNIQETLELICDELDLEKIIIFVDDLDRLPAKYATEILEVFKVLLDINRCVFVLAIDFAVIQQGLREKYNDNITELHVKKFFDKIVQVPFHIPILRAGHEAYLRRALKAILMDAPTREESKGASSEGAGIKEKTLDKYIEMIPGEEFANFRELKCLLNSFSLVILIAARASEDIQLDEDWALDLFGALCLQMAFPDIYLHLSAEEEVFLERVRRLSEDDELEILFDGSRGRLESFRRFFDVLGRRFQSHRSTVGNGAHDSSERGGENLASGWDVKRFLSACQISSTVTNDTLSKSDRSKDERPIRAGRSVKLHDLMSENKNSIYSMALLVGKFLDELGSHVVMLPTLSAVPTFEVVYGESRKILWESVTEAFFLSADGARWGWFRESAFDFTLNSPLDLCVVNKKWFEGAPDGSHGSFMQIFSRPFRKLRIHMSFNQKSLFCALRLSPNLRFSERAATLVNAFGVFCIANKDEDTLPNSFPFSNADLVFRVRLDGIVSGDEVAEGFLRLLKELNYCIVDNEGRPR